MCPRGQENSRGSLIPLILPGKIVKTCAKIYEKGPILFQMSKGQRKQLIIDWTIRESIFQLRVWRNGDAESLQVDPGRSFGGEPEEKLMYFNR